MEKINRKTAVVTGASSGIGLAVAKMLCHTGYEGCGFGRDFSGVDGNISGNEAFHCIVCDLTDTNALAEHVRQIRKEHEVCVLVNNAGVGYYGLHEELKPRKIQEMVRVNLEVPMILSQLLLRDIKKNAGSIVNISSVTAAGLNPRGCAYGATKAGLSSFSHSLFEENRRYGVRVITIQPDMTRTGLYRHADFTASGDEEASLSPEEVAEAVRFALEQRDGLVVADMTVRPQKHRIEKKKGNGNRHP